MIDFFNDYTEGPVSDMPFPRGAVPEGMVKSTPVYKAMGMAAMKGGADIAGAGVLAAGGLAGLMEGGPLPVGASDKVFDFYKDYIEPAKKYWTPDPESVSMAGRFLGGVSSLAVPALLGPAGIPAMVGSSTFDTADNLLRQGVDSKTATVGGILAGTATAAMAGLPMGQMTLAARLAVIAANPAIGAGQTLAEKELLKSGGYDELAKSYNPFDPTERALDLAMGTVFGGLAQYHQWRSGEPVHVGDTIDTASLAQATQANSPFQPKDLNIHEDALNKAINDIDAGKPVDVTDIVKNVPVADFKTEPVSPEAEEAGKIAMTAIKANEANMKGILEQQDMSAEPLKPEEAIPSEKTAPIQPMTDNLETKMLAPERPVLNEPIETEAERILTDNPDLKIHTGTDASGEPVVEDARTVVDTARADVEKTTLGRELWNMATECLRLG